MARGTNIVLDGAALASRRWHRARGNARRCHLRPAPCSASDRFKTIVARIPDGMDVDLMSPQSVRRYTSSPDAMPCCVAAFACNACYLWVRRTWKKRWDAVGWRWLRWGDRGPFPRRQWHRVRSRSIRVTAMWADGRHRCDGWLRSPPRDRAALRRSC